MKYWSVYERKESSTILSLVADIGANSPEEALKSWYDRFGDNYGKVIILPASSSSKSRVFVEVEA